MRAYVRLAGMVGELPGFSTIRLIPFFFSPRQEGPVECHPEHNLLSALPGSDLLLPKTLSSLETCLPLMLPWGQENLILPIIVSYCQAWQKSHLFEVSLNHWSLLLGGNPACSLPPVSQMISIIYQAGGPVRRLPL